METLATVLWTIGHFNSNNWRLNFWLWSKISSKISLYVMSRVIVICVAESLASDDFEIDTKIEL